MPREPEDPGPARRQARDSISRESIAGADLELNCEYVKAGIMLVSLYENLIAACVVNSLSAPLVPAGNPCYTVNGVVREIT
jgi:hypothetical protein